MNWLKGGDNHSVIAEKEWKRDFLALKSVEFALKRGRDDIEENKMCFEWNLVINEKLFAKGIVDLPKRGEDVFMSIGTEVAIVQRQNLESSCSYSLEVCS